VCGYPYYVSYALNVCSSPAKRVYKVHNLSPEEAVLVEPLACALHGMDKLQAPVGVEVLLIGAGPTGLLLAQLLKLNGASKVTIAANKGPKTELARTLDCADEYIELDRANPDGQWEKLKSENPYGFDIVVSSSSFSVCSSTLKVYSD
jgi:D-arabinitol dehydrogenase (NADP+)